MLVDTIDPVAVVIDLRRVAGDATARVDGDIIVGTVTAAPGPAT